MKNEVFFSVIIPVYNAEKTIAACISSVLAQSFSDFEIILIDDGSTDHAEQKIKPFLDDSVFYFKNESQMGPSFTRNKGVKNASGQYLVFLDADDYFHPEKLKIIHAVLIKNPLIDFIFHDFSLKNIQIPTDIPALNRVSYFKLIWRNIIATPCVIMRNNAAFYFDEKLKYMEDFELFLRVAKTTKIYHLPLALTQLGRPVLSIGGQSENKWAMRKAEWSIYKKFAKTDFLTLILYPFLIIFSMLKHLFKKIITPIK